MRTKSNAHRDRLNIENLKKSESDMRYAGNATLHMVGEINLLESGRSVLRLYTDQPWKE
jgi:hypothetical protein